MSTQPRFPLAVTACLIGLLCALPCPGQAAKIELTNGQSLEGAIIEESDSLVRLRLKGMPTLITLPRSQIKSIERQEEYSKTETDGDQQRAQREFSRARELYRAALESAARAGDRTRLEKKIQECSDEIKASNQAELDKANARALELVERNGFDKIALGLRALDEIRVEGQPGGLEGVTDQDVGRKKALLYAEKARRELDRLDYEAASRSLDAAIGHDSRLARLYIMRGDLALKTGARQDKIIDNYLKGLELADDQMSVEERARYHFAVGRLLRAKNQNAEAVRHLLKSLDLAPNLIREAPAVAAEAYLIAIASDEDLGAATEEATATLRRLIGLNPGGLLAVRLRQRLADVYFLEGQTEKAIEELKNILVSFPNIEEIHYRIGKSYFGLYEKAKTKEEQKAFLGKAQQAFNDEIAINPNNYEAMCDLANVYLQQFQLEEARDILTRALELEPAKWRAHYFAMNVYKRLGDRQEEGSEEYDKALKHADEFISYRGESHPEYYEAIILQAIIMIKRKQYSEAEAKLDVVDKALKDKPEKTLTPIERRSLSSAYNYRGQIVAEREDIFDALGKYDKALALYDKNADAYANMGDALKRQAALRAGNQAERDALYLKAETAFQRAIELELDNPDRYQALGILYYRDMKNGEKALPQFKEYLRHGGQSEQIRKYISDIEKTTPQ